MVFAGFEVPPPVYLAGLAGGLVVVAVALYATRPPVGQRTALALVPWVVTGATLHVFYQLGQAFPPLYPIWAGPLFAAPAVYVTTFLLAGLVWVAGAVFAARTTDPHRSTLYLGLVGTGVATVLLVFLARQALSPAIEAAPLVPVVAVVVTGVLTAVVYVLVGLWRTYVLAEARLVGGLVLFAHLLDGISTAIGVDVLGVTERSVLPARIIAFAGGLPTEPYLGSGWLFVVVKLLLAVLIVVALADYVSEEPGRGTLLMTAVAAVGLGPAVNNLLIFFLGL